MILFKIFLIGAGGFIGAVSRYYLGGYIHQLLNKQDFPYGTITVNMIGCLIIGFLGGLAESRQLFSGETRLFVFIGLLGAFTTFSTFGYETMKLLWDNQLFKASLNVGAHIILGLFAVWLGNIFSKIF
jgi:fluoride exporter